MNKLRCERSWDFVGTLWNRSQNVMERVTVWIGHPHTAINQLDTDVVNSTRVYFNQYINIIEKVST